MKIEFFPRLLLSVILCCGTLMQTCYAINQSNNLISLSVKQTEISELYEMLSRENKVNILLASGVEGEVSVNLYDISVRDAIYAIASAAGLAVERIKKGYLITKRSDVGKTIAGGMTDLRTFKVQYSDSKKVSEILENHLSEYGKIDILEDRKILVIEDLPEFIDRIEKLLRVLDQAPAQILIEAKIFNIILDDSQKFGVDWTKTFAAGGGKGNIGVENLGSQVLDLAIGSAAGPAGLFFNYFNNNIEVQLNLLSRKGRLRTLASPSLLALEHQESQVIIGDRQGYKLTTVNVGVSTESIEFLESGVILRVTAFIDRFGRIMMDIHPEISSGTIKDSLPTQQTTEVHTQLLVEHGQTVFIGGLIRNTITSSHQGIPILEDIPFLGLLFAKEDDISNMTETIVMIKPQIISMGNTNLITSPQERVDQFNDFSQQQSNKIDRFFKEKFLYKKPEESENLN
jgi:type II secretory pathway component GspD/PulD (secretin)